MHRLLAIMLKKKKIFLVFLGYTHNDTLTIWWEIIIRHSKYVMSTYYIPGKSNDY